MVIYSSFILVFLAIIVVAPYISASPIGVPLNHWSYHFIERLQAKGVLRDFLSNTKPYSRDEMAEMIVRISNLLENNRISLSKVEEDQLDLMKMEFSPELAKLGMVGITEYKHLLNWANDKKRLVMDIGYTQDAILKRGSEDYETYKSTLQGIFWGNLGDNIFFYNNSKASYEDSNEPLPLMRSYPYSYWRYPWNAISDAFLILRFPYIDVQLGKDAVLWGPGYDGTIGLSGVDPSFDIVKISTNIWKIKFASMLGFLRDDLTKKYESDIAKKYLFAHRVEINPFTGLCIGWQEAYVYNNIHIELLNPIMPYQMAEDYLGEVGNNTMEGDIDLCVLPNTKLYASLFLDDFHPDNPFRYAAVLGGVLIVNPVGIRNLDFRAEYARIEPGVYVHKGITQNPPIPTSYTHFDTPLGHWIGPNADDLFFEVNHQFTENLLVRLSYNRIRKGEIGGSIYDYDELAESEKTRFLMGIVEKTKTIGLGLKYRIFQDSTIGIEYSYIKVYNKQKEEAKLPRSDKRKQPWEAGHTWLQNIIQVTITLKY